ncbi:MAG: lipopolysaccharide biosynthesis protein [Methylococcales bacterium]
MAEHPNANSIISKAIPGIRWSILLKSFSQILTWVATLVIVRHVTPEEYGMNAMLEVPFEILTIFSLCGLDRAIIQAKTIESQQLKSVFGLLLLINFLIFGVFFWGADLISWYYKEPRLATYVQALSICFLIAPFRIVPDALLDRNLDFKTNATVNLSCAIATSLGALALALQGAGIWALIVAKILGVALPALVLAVVRPWFILPSFKLSEISHLIWFGGSMLFMILSHTLANKVPALIAGPIVGAEELGYFSLAMYFAFLPLSKIMPIVNQAIFPVFSRLQREKEQAKRYYRKSIRLIALAFFPITFGLAAVGEEFVLVFLGGQWRAATNLLVAMAVVMPCRMIFNTYLPILNSMGCVRLTNAASAIMLAAVTLASALGIRWGMLGLTLAWSFVIPFTMMVIVRMSREAVGISMRRLLIEIGPALIASSIMMVCVAGFKAWMPIADPKWLLAYEILLGACVYPLVLRLFFPAALREVKAAMSKRQ